MGSTTSTLCSAPWCGPSMLNFTQQKLLLGKASPSKDSRLFYTDPSLISQHGGGVHIYSSQSIRKSLQTELFWSAAPTQWHCLAVTAGLSQHRAISVSENSYGALCPALSEAHSRLSLSPWDIFNIHRSVHNYKWILPWRRELCKRYRC